MKVLSGKELFLQLKSKLVIHSTGSSSFDSISDGGIWGGEITELFGVLSSGKTQCCYSVVAKSLLHCNDDSVIVWIDSNCSFKPKRLKEILEHISNNTHMESALSRVQVMRAFDWSMLEDSLKRVQSLLLTKTIRIVVVDMIGSALWLTSFDINLGRCMQSKIEILLRKFTKEGVAVLLVNHAVKPWSSGKIRPALGLTWARNIHTSYHFNEPSMIECDGAVNKVVTVTLHKCGRMSLGKSCDLVLTASGICDLNENLQSASLLYTQSVELNPSVSQRLCSMHSDDLFPDSPELEMEVADLQIEENDPQTLNLRYVDDVVPSSSNSSPKPSIKPISDTVALLEKPRLSVGEKLNKSHREFEWTADEMDFVEDSQPEDSSEVLPPTPKRLKMKRRSDGNTKSFSVRKKTERSLSPILM